MTERKKSLLCICPSVFVMLTCVIQLLLPIKPANGTDVQRKLLMWFYFFFLNSCGFIFNDTCARCNCLSVHLCKINVGIDYATRLHRFTQTIGNIIMCLNSFSRYISSTNSHGGGKSTDNSVKMSFTYLLLVYKCIRTPEKNAFYRGQNDNNDRPRENTK